jgi:hypothetical protein
MFKGSQSGDDELVIIEATDDYDDYTTWIANEMAECDVDLSGNWTGKLTKNNSEVAYCVLEIGSYTLDQQFITHEAIDADFLGNECDFTINARSWTTTIREEEYLAFRVTNQDTNQDLFIETAGGVSWLSFPSTDPGYPVPELSTIILMSTGLLALAGYVGLTRIRNK